MSTNQMQWLFATPVMEFNLAEHTTTIVKDAILRMNQSKNDLVHGVRASQNPAELTECKTLYEVFHKCIDEYANQLGFVKNVIYESWVNVLYKNGAVNVHRHPNSIISGAYYPHVAENSAELIFINPVDGFRQLDLTEHLPFSEIPNNPYAGVNIHRVRAVTGKLVLFPSWLQHYVPQNNSDLRITLSFNTIAAK